MTRKTIFAAVFAALAALVEAAQPKNVILFIGDGMGVAQRMVAETYSKKTGGGSLAINTMPNHSTTTTHSASSLVTDSAAAVTAIACGEKTNNGMLGLSPDGRRLESCAEVAKKSGKRVGIVTSVTINHATPAGFYAHRPHRSHLYEIGLQLTESGFDVFMGGGLAGKYDGEKGNVYEIAKANGYVVAEGRSGFDAISTIAPGTAKVWWRGGEQALPYAIDVEPGDDTPRLPEITRRSIELLGDDGFFLMVEGGRIDFAGHDNDGAANLFDTLEFDRAVAVALDYQKTHPETLVIVTGDHETGGMSLGASSTGYAFYVELLGRQTCSSATFKTRYDELKKNGAGFDEAAALVERSYGFKFGNSEEDPMALSENDIAGLRRHFDSDGFPDKARRIMQAKAGVGWTSGSHTGVPVLTTAIGPGSESFTGLIDNTDIAKTLKSLMERQ
ncbi:MAG: alkaline phosphatase [Kiritimatiellae bacterium]|nr:alkaline phosphatase [Kiritimatiellia bacterium]